MFNLAKKIAQRSKHPQHHHAVIITRGGAHIAFGYNHSFRHAEIMALRQLFPDDGSGCTLWSFRWRKNGTFGMARPCEHCAYAIGLAGIKKVYFTNEEGLLVKL